MAERRFGEISDEELARLIAEGTNQNTCKATATWLRTVTTFRNEKKLDRNLDCARKSFSSE